MSYLWLPAQRIVVELEEGLPQRLWWQEQVHEVQWLATNWRIDGWWWEQRIWRHYYKLVTDTGLLLLVFYDLVDEQWYLQQVYD